MKIRDGLFFCEMWEDFFAEEFGLFGTIVTPEFEEDVGAAGVAILFEFFDALIGSAGDGANFFENGIGDGASGGFATPGFHGFGDGTNFVEC